ncbi:unnamed protein product, partial [marine sediment metagenome]
MPSEGPVSGPQQEVASLDETARARELEDLLA